MSDADERPSGTLRQAIRESGVGWYPLGALGGLVVAFDMTNLAFVLFAPDISRTLGVGKGALTALFALRIVALSVAGLFMAAYVQARPRRALVAVVTAVAWSVLAIAMTFVSNVVGLLVVLLLFGAATASTSSIHPPLVVDSYPPGVRVRALAFLRAANSAGSIAAPLMVAFFYSALGLTWRGVFLLMGAVSLVVSIASVRLRDPGFGRWDQARVRESVNQVTGAGSDDDLDVTLGFFEIVHRLAGIPTVRRLLVGNAVLGMLLIPLYTYFLFFLEERWGLGPRDRALLFAVFSCFSLAALGLLANRGEAMFRRDPTTLIRVSAIALATGVGVLGLAILSPVFVVMVVLMGIALALFAVMTPALSTVLLSVVPPRMRPHAAALQGIFLAGVGGFAGLILLGGVEQQYGTAGAIISLALPGIGGAFAIRTARHTVADDLARMADEVLEEEVVRSLHKELPLLACRGIDFSYGQHQVLFGVDFSVADGEMVALLGTNGAGKSTLLNVISGLGLPTRGSVRFHGADITYVSAERRVQFGVIQILGGRAVFGPLTVGQNLRLFGYSIGRDGKALERSIDSCYEAFPHLADLTNQPASTLSGGEQQMLALSKAFILKPRVLLIDELSLGLAPKIVEELLTMVRRINETGAAVVLVEQSVNIALSLVDHAYFMEKGQTRFDGAAKDLLARDDLLRSVFLRGAAMGHDLSPSGASRA